MIVQRSPRDNGSLQVELLDEAGKPVPVISSFLRYLSAREYSPNTLIGYAYDLKHLWLFLSKEQLTWQSFKQSHAFLFLEYLRSIPSRRGIHQLSLVTVVDGKSATYLMPSTINRIIAAVSSFYEFAVASGYVEGANPIQQRVDPALHRVSDRHRPFLDGVSRQAPMRRVLAVKTVHRLPRVLSDEQITALFGASRCQRDLALIRLMLDGGLRPGEALGLHLEDVAYGRRRVTIRYRNDHPKGVRAKSRFERVVDLHEPVTLAAVTDYVMTDRPPEATSPFVFLIGGNGRRRLEPMSYAALAKLFTRACERAAIRTPWLTLHALRHTHATRMWDGGMRELTLQKRLGHASPESTRIYTRVSDPIVVAEYQKALGMQQTPKRSRHEN